MKAYLNLLQHILDDGVRKENRTGTDTISVFGCQLRFSLRDGFPLVTTKRVHVRSVIYELLWMLNGDTNVKFLNDHGVTIWDEWASNTYRPEMGHPQGELGPVYGSQWRAWTMFHPLPAHPSGFVVGPVDQIARISDALRNNPGDRRIILSAWNVGVLHEMKLPPCHLLAQFNVTYGRLSCHMYIRSWDVFLGGPFNIAQYALLTHMLAHSCDLDVGDLVISSGDTHLYVNHLDQVRTQLGREPRPLPRLTITPRGQDILSTDHGKMLDDGAPVAFEFEDFAFEGYVPHPGIKADVSV